MSQKVLFQTEALKKALGVSDKRVVHHWIAGQHVLSEGESLPVYNPATGEVTKSVSIASHQLVEDAIRSASEAFLSWSRLSLIKRTQVLHRFRALLDVHRLDLAAAITAEHGKVLSDAEGEVLRGLELVEQLCAAPTLLQGSYSSGVATGVHCYTFRQPLGVCVGITPFNFPVMIACWQIIPAIVSGNTFILKPSEKDPSSILMLAELLREAGLPDGVLNVVQGNGDTAEALYTHPQVRAVTCVGSTPVAKDIYQKAISLGKRAVTFGGAKNHCIVMPDAPLEQAISGLVSAGYGAAGERCMAISVVVAVTDAVADALVEGIQKAIPQLHISTGTDPKSDYGPMVTAPHRSRVMDYIALGEKEGADLVVDGRTFQCEEHSDGFFLGPSLFDRVTPEMRIYQEEIFGPVLSIVRVSTLDEAIALVNAHRYANGVSIYTKNGYCADQFSQEIEVGMVGINVPIPVPVAYHSFGGWKESVFGDVRMHADESLRFYTQAKSVTARWDKTQDILNLNMPVN